MNVCRSTRSMKALWLASFFLLLAARPVAPAVLGIDFGSEWLKIAVVKTGKPMISIVINEMSKRKAPTQVGFSNGERLLGEEAAALVGRYPDRVYARLRDALGKPLDQARALFDANYLPYDTVQDPTRGSVKVRTHDGKEAYSVEEMVAMVLSYARSIAEVHSKQPCKDVVITVPPYFGQANRQALMDGAEIAGLNVMGLIGEHAAAALQYGLWANQDFTQDAKNVLLYDMGANSVHAAVAQFTSYPAKQFGKNTTVNQFQMKGLAWDASLGGQTMEGVLMEHFAEQINKQLKGKVDIRKFPKSMAKLRKEVKRTKEVLSANTEAPISVESIHEEFDFRSSIKREEFEALCGDLWKRAVDPVKAALKEANLTVAELHAFELVGGATRVPKLQAVLTEFLATAGDKQGLDKHLDADEAMALGAGLHAANLSDAYKLRNFGMLDGLPYGLVMSVEGGGLGGETEGEGALEDSKAQTLFHRMRKLPSKIIRSFKDQTQDFKVAVQYDPAGELPPGTISREVATFEITNVAETVNKYKDNATAPVKVSLHFSLSSSGLLALDKAEAVIEVTEMVEVPLPKNSSANATAPANATASTADAAAASKSGGGKDESAEGASKEEKRQTTLKKKKRTLRLPLKVNEVTSGLVKGMPKAALDAAKERHAALRLKDEKKREAAEAKNSLEAYIYATKDKLGSLEGVEKVSSEAQRESLQADLEAAEDWLYMDGEHAPVADFTKKLAALREKGEPIFLRVEQLTARPAAVAAARKFIASTHDLLSSWDTTKPWINETLKAQVYAACSELGKWLEGREEAQAKLALDRAPAFLSKEVEKRVASVAELVRGCLALGPPGCSAYLPAFLCQGIGWVAGKLCGVPAVRKLLTAALGEGLCSEVAKLSRIPKPKPKPSPKPAQNATEATNGTEKAEPSVQAGEGEEGLREPKDEEPAEGNHDEL